MCGVCDLRQVRMEERRCACFCCMLSSCSGGVFFCDSVKLDTSIEGCAFLTPTSLKT